MKPKLRETNIMVRLTRDEKKSVKIDARTAGLRLSDWVRYLLFAPKLYPTTTTASSAETITITDKPRRKGK